MSNANVMLSCTNVSIRYRVGDFKNIGLKEWVMRRLTGKYKVIDFWADKDISFEINEGDMLGIIGTNGAGKSTLLKAVTGIMEPTKGRIVRRGKVSALLELASGFDGDLTVKENAYLRGAMLGYTRKFMDETYPYIIEFSELKEFEDRQFKQLSSGMKSRLAFAIASLVKPEILILDEVLSVGDGAFRAKSEAKMREIIKGGATTILVSHSIPQVRAMCNKVLWLENGRQIAFTDDIEGACDCYEEYLRNRKDSPLYDPVAAKIRIDARAAEKARREAAARQMAEDAAKLCKVSFDVDSEGAEGVETRLVKKGVSVGSLPVPTRKGYSFIGWYTQKAGGMKISASSVVTGNTTYYAQWRANTYVVRFHRNHSSFDTTVKEQSFTYGREQELSWISGGLKWDNPNHAFLGWAKTSEGAVAYSNGQKVSNLTTAQGAVVHLHAIWRYLSLMYTVRYHKYDGSGTTCDQTFKIGEEQNLLWISGGLKWSRPGYEFVGWVPWNPNVKARLCKYVNGQVVKDIGKKDEIVHLYAAWKSASSYRICFHRNTSSSDAATMNQVFLRNKEESLAWMDSQIGWTRSGYLFKGWSESAGSTVVKYANGAKVKDLAMNGGTKHLYAVWRSLSSSASAASYAMCSVQPLADGYALRDGNSGDNLSKLIP